MHKPQADDVKKVNYGLETKCFHCRDTVRLCKTYSIKKENRAVTWSKAFIPWFAKLCHNGLACQINSAPCSWLWWRLLMESKQSWFWEYVICHSFHGGVLGEIKKEFQSRRMSTANQSVLAAVRWRLSSPKASLAALLLTVDSGGKWYNL